MIGGEILLLETCDRRTGKILYKKPRPGMCIDGTYEQHAVQSNIYLQTVCWVCGLEVTVALTKQLLFWLVLSQVVTILWPVTSSIKMTNA